VDTPSDDRAVIQAIQRELEEMGRQVYDVPEDKLAAFAQRLDSLTDRLRHEIQRRNATR
jgi:hypothetical protein